MKTQSRRKFFRNASIVTAGVMIAPNEIIKRQRRNAIGCAPASVLELTGTVTSVKDGLWSDPSTWGNKIPMPGDLIAVNHNVIYDLNTSTFAGVNINGSLVFDSYKSSELVSTQNIILQGYLQMKPANTNVTQSLKFAGINENNFVGGGMDPIASDIGLWVMGNGQLDIQGSAKTSWTNSVNYIAAGDTNLGVRTTQGWAAGDQLVICPTESIQAAGEGALNRFDERIAKSISGNNVAVDPFTFNHPTVNLQWTAEVLNLTRNVRIEGTASGKSHIFIRSTKPQNIKYVQFRYLGPRKDTSGDGVKELVLGRYGLHFHHSMDGSRGSVVEGCVMRDVDNHAYVPHVSHGILFKSNVSYNTTETAFWWDEQTSSHDIVYDGNIVANVKYLNRSLAVDTEDPTTPNFAVAGMILGMGDDNVSINNVIVGSNTGDEGSGAGYFWQANNEGVWKFKNNLVHNTRCGVLTWQNSTRNHIVEGTTIYHCNKSLMHGAYANSYTYKGGVIFASPMRIEASSGDTNKVRLEKIVFDGGNLVDYGAEIISSPIPAPQPTYFRGCSFKGFKKAGIVDAASNETKNIDVIQCYSIGTLAVVDPGATASEVIRVQPASGQAIKISRSGTSNISNFAPSIYGDGEGLKCELFNDSTLTNKVHERVDSVVAFQEWSAGIHYKITGIKHSMRWTGQIMPQYSESYTFTLSIGGGVRLWVDNKLIFDKWQDSYPNIYDATPINLTAGQKYNIKIEYFNSEDERTGINLYWRSASLPQEYVPQSQLFNDFTETTVPPVEPPQDQPVTVNAGPDPAAITLPTNSVRLNGSASGYTSLKWSKVSGPANFAIGSDSSPSTDITGLTAGTYVFRLTATGNKGQQAFDEVQVLVNPAPTVKFTFTIAPNPTRTEWKGSVKSDKSGSIKLTVIDTNTGRVMDQVPAAPQSASLAFGSKYPTGSYTLIAEQNGVTATFPLSKIK